jgi:hypothetical protein
MGWLEQVGGLLQQYSGAAAAGRAPERVEEDYDRLTESAPRNALADGIAAAFRSDQTPPFSRMITDLFTNSNGQEKANLINTLIGAVGPALASHFLSRSGATSLAGLLSSGQDSVTPEVASQIPAEAVQEMANEAEQKDPSIIDQVSDFYSSHPTLIKTLGGAALTIALAKLAEKHSVL